MNGVLNEISIASLVLAFICPAIVVIDIAAGQRQQMTIMNWVWPITAIWSGPLGLWAYFRFGRSKKDGGSKQTQGGGNQKQPKSGGSEKSKEELERKAGKPFWQIVSVGDTHCAAGCTLGDIMGEWIVVLTGFALLGSVLWADYLLDFVLAYSFGIIFQYFAIAPMRNLSGWPGIWAAIKADTISLTTFEIGLFGWMALTHEVLFHPALKPEQPAYWFMMQVGMAIGFLTSWPANWWLIRKGVKEAM